MTDSAPAQEPQPSGIEELMESLSMRMAINRAATARRTRLQRMEHSIVQRHQQQQGKL